MYQYTVTTLQFFLHRWLYISVIFIVLMGWFIQPLSHALDLETIRVKTNEKGAVNGWFLQCVIEGESRIVSRGRYVMEPTEMLIWEILHPRNVKLTVDADGNVIKENDGVKKSKNARYQRMGRLLAAIFSLQRSKIERQFSIETMGQLDNYIVRLLPKKRMSRYIKEIKLNGSQGMTKSIIIRSHPERIIRIILMEQENSDISICELAQ